MKILVVDDELGPRESFRMLLKDRYEVHTADCGADALARVSENDYSLVFLDMRMPGMDGVAVLAELRRLRPQLPVVIVTAYASVEDTAQALEMGAMDCLIKPFNRRDVDYLVERARQQRP